MNIGRKPDTALCGEKESNSKAFDPFKGDKKTGLSTKTGLFLFTVNEKRNARCRKTVRLKTVRLYKLIGLSA